MQSHMKRSIDILFLGLFLNLCYGLPTGVCFLDNLKIFFIFESNHGKTTPYFKNSKSLATRKSSEIFSGAVMSKPDKKRLLNQGFRIFHPKQLMKILK